MTRFLIAPDKFKGTLSGQDFCATVSPLIESFGHESQCVTLADGGDGTLDAFGGPNQQTQVTGPDGKPVMAAWRLEGAKAIIETALCSGLTLAGGAEANDPMLATSRGSGELIAAAVARGAKTLVVGIGGSAMTDGGLPAVRAIQAAGGPWRDVKIMVACDVQTAFVDAARVFGPQKGADEEQVRLLTERLEEIRATYKQEFGIDVHQTPGSGAAGGLGGGLLALGATFAPGFELVAQAKGLDAKLEHADVIITGEGRFDQTSLSGKVVGALIDRTTKPVIVIAGQVAHGVKLPRHVRVLDLSRENGLFQAMGDPVGCIQASLPPLLKIL